MITSDMDHSTFGYSQRRAWVQSRASCDSRIRIRARNVYTTMSNIALTSGLIVCKKGIRTPVVRRILLAYCFWVRSATHPLGVCLSLMLFLINNANVRLLVVRWVAQIEFKHVTCCVVCSDALPSSQQDNMQLWRSDAQGTDWQTHSRAWGKLRRLLLNPSKIYSMRVNWCLDRKATTSDDHSRWLRWWMQL